MSKTLKIFFIVLGLSIFILPKQMINAQTIVECCDQMSPQQNCCKTEKTQSCHSDNSNTKSDKNNCGEDCTQCHSCTVNFVLNYLSPEINSTLGTNFFIQKLKFEYGTSYFLSTLQNIWQPPKIG